MLSPGPIRQPEPVWGKLQPGRKHCPRQGVWETARSPFPPSSRKALPRVAAPYQVQGREGLGSDWTQLLPHPNIWPCLGPGWVGFSLGQHEGSR